jgi:hypothetical protein
MINVGLADFQLTDLTFVQRPENCLPSNEQYILSTAKKTVSFRKKSQNHFYKNCSDIQYFLIYINFSIEESKCLKKKYIQLNVIPFCHHHFSKLHSKC